jgi:hypothetical protein
MAVQTRGRTLDAALWMAAIGFLAAIIVFSVGPPPETLAPEFSDKVKHAAAYAGVTFTTLLAAVWRPGRGVGRFPRARYWIPLAALALGILLEILQGTIEAWNRRGDPVDMVWNGLGVAVAAGAWMAIRARGS